MIFIHYNRSNGDENSENGMKWNIKWQEDTPKKKIMKRSVQNFLRLKPAWNLGFTYFLLTLHFGAAKSHDPPTPARDNAQNHDRSFYSTKKYDGQNGQNTYGRKGLTHIFSCYNIFAPWFMAASHRHGTSRCLN